MKKYYTEYYDFETGRDVYVTYDENGRQVGKKSKRRPQGLELAHRKGTYFEIMHRDEIKSYIGDVFVL